MKVDITEELSVITSHKLMHKGKQIAVHFFLTLNFDPNFSHTLTHFFFQLAIPFVMTFFFHVIIFNEPADQAHFIIFHEGMRQPS